MAKKAGLLVGTGIKATFKVTQDGDIMDLLEITEIPPSGTK
jgi:hypothetical protein